jgi:hypothetical protein
VRECVKQWSSDAAVRLSRSLALLLGDHLVAVVAVVAVGSKLSNK